MSCKPPLCALTRSRIFLVFQVDAPNLTYPPVPFAPPLPPYSPPKGGEAPQSSYFSDLVDCVGPLTQAVSWVWQDTNRNTQKQRA